MTTELALPPVGALSIERARVLIAQSKSVDETLRYRAMAKAMLVFQREHDAGLAAEADAMEIVQRAVRRIGEQMREEPKAKGAAATGGPGRGRQNAGPNPTQVFRSWCAKCCRGFDTATCPKCGAPRTHYEVPGPPIPLAQRGIDKHLADEARKAARMPPEEHEAVVAAMREHILSKQTREARRKREHAARKAQRKAAPIAAAKAAPERAVVHDVDAVTFAGRFKAKSIDLLVTDPPFMTDIGDINAFAAWLLSWLPKLKPTSRAYVCCGAYSAELYAYLTVVHQACSFDRSQVLVWTYRNRIGPTPTHDYVQNWQAILHLWGKDAPPLTSPNLNEQFAVQDINAPDGRQGDHWHAWQKPDELARRIITHASKPGELVVDPFCGTGTFLLAAARLGRKAVGADIDPKMIALAIERGCKRG